MEYLDILDSKGNKTGVIQSYDEAHKLGLVHRSVHVWVVNNNKEILLQKRNATRQAYPNYWDISASGHISSGETSRDAATKEALEEIGLVVRSEELVLIGVVEEHIVLNGGSYVSNEFQDIYVVMLNEDSSDFVIGLDEVSEIKWVSDSLLRNMVSDRSVLVVPHEEEYRILLSYIESL
jgi:isopentenyldiphosphate isomerase